MSEQKSFTKAVVDCLISNAPHYLEQYRDQLQTLVARVLDEASEDQADRLHKEPSRQQLEEYLTDIRAILPAEHDRIALVNGGATKIKGYVFEAPKLPEIRGASVLLDWIGDDGLKRLVAEQLGDNYAKQCFIYAGGGSFLLFAPADKAQVLADRIEQYYTQETLIANSVAVTRTFRLLELRYGRLFDENGTIPFWINEFEDHWKNEQYQRLLNQYYYMIPVVIEGLTDTRARFYNRKSFGELVTLLASDASRRREQQDPKDQRIQRNIPHFDLIPWAEKCDSSDIRPAMAQRSEGDFGDEIALSEPSGRKRIIGRSVKGVEPERWLEPIHNAWSEDTISAVGKSSWKKRWEDFLAGDGRDTLYAKAFRQMQENVYPAHDIGEIAGASEPERYIGIIYADGDNVGRLMATIRSPAEYQAKSEILSTAAERSVFQALATCLIPKQVTASEERSKNVDEYIYVHPFEILTIGGDDLFILVPGSKAIDVACGIGLAFEKMVANLLAFDTNAQPASLTYQRYKGSSSFLDEQFIPSIGLSAGIIIARENTPIFLLRDLVEELQKRAKKKAKQSTKHHFYGGAVDFMVMKSIGMVADTIVSFRREALGDSVNTERRLTARPYTWHELAGLITTIRELKKSNFPTSQLHRIRESIDSTVVQSVMDYLYISTRQSDEQRTVLHQFVEHGWGLGTVRANQRFVLPLWIPYGDSNGMETFWPDLVELYDLIEQEASA